MLEKRVKLTSRRRSNGDTGEEEQRFKTYWATWCLTFAIHSQLMDKILRKVVYLTICIFFPPHDFLYQPTFLHFVYPSQFNWFVEWNVAVKRVGWRGISRPNLHTVICGVLWSIAISKITETSSVACLKINSQAGNWKCTIKLDDVLRGFVALDSRWMGKWEKTCQIVIYIYYSWSAIHFFAAVSFSLGETSSSLAIPVLH